MFRSNNCTLFHFWWKKNLVKHQKVSKYYEIDCLQDSVFLFMFLLTVKFVNNSHIYESIFLFLVTNVLKQTWNSFNTKFQPHWKDRKSTYQVRQIFGPFLLLICSDFRLKQLESLQSYQKTQRNEVWICIGPIRIKREFK